MAIDKHIIFVLGMHRSGASAVVRMLNLLGAALERGHSIGDPSNPAKTERQQNTLVEINEKVLSALDSGWFDFSNYPGDWWEQHNFDRYKKQIKALIDSKHSASEITVLKDPQLCRLLPLWLDALKFSGRKLNAILVLRHPDEVVASICAQTPLTEDTAYLLWAIHTKEAELASRAVPRVIIQYQEVLNDWNTSASRIADALSISWHGLNNASARKISQEINPALKHHHKHSVAGKNKIHQACLTIWQSFTCDEELDTSKIDKLWQEFSPYLEVGEIIGRVSLGVNKRLFYMENDLDHRIRLHDEDIGKQSTELGFVIKQNQMARSNLEELLQKIDSMEQAQHQKIDELEHEHHQNIDALKQSQQQTIEAMAQTELHAQHEIKEREQQIASLQEDQQHSQLEIQDKEAQIASLNKKLKHILSNRMVRAIIRTFDKSLIQ